MGQFFIPVNPLEGGLVIPTAASVAYYITRDISTTVKITTGVVIAATVINFALE